MVEVCDWCKTCEDNNGNLTHCMNICFYPVKALEELQEYRKIGTLQECRERIQEAELIHTVDGFDECENCGNAIEDHERYCSRCGKKIRRKK